MLPFPPRERGRVREGVLLAKRILAAEEIAARPDPHPAPVGADLPLSGGGKEETYAAATRATKWLTWRLSVASMRAI
jgi:hypothetical protein